MLNRDLIVFGEDWGALPSSTQHLIKHLKNNRKVLWINSIGLRKPHFNAADIRRAANKLLKKIVGDKKSGQTQKHVSMPDFQVHTLLSIPAPNTPAERAISRKLIAFQLNKKIQSMGLNDPIIWASLPTVSDLKSEFPHTPFVYYCGDDFSALAGVDHQCVAQHEVDLVTHCDAIFAASETLVERFPALKTHLLTHGVDHTLFSHPAHPALDLPNNGKPTAGFYGSLSQWLDVDLLATVMRRCKDWNFVFIGKKDCDLTAIESLPNAYFIGPREHSQLPSYAQHWQVSMLPFKDNDQIRACNPLKLREYLAAGSEILSTPFPALTPYQQEVVIGSTAEQWIDALNRIKALNDCRFSNTSRVRKQNLVSSEAWEYKATQVNAWLGAL